MSEKYRETGYRVQRKSRAQIRKAAHQLRDFIEAQYGFAGDAVDVVQLVQKWGLIRANGAFDNPDYLVVEDLCLPGRAAEFRPRPKYRDSAQDDDDHIFIVRDSVWDAASAGGSEARETLGHEVGHCVLEHPAPSYARMYQDDIVEWEEDSEWQANTFMVEFLMDSRRIASSDSWGQIMVRFNVTRDAAIRRLRELMNDRVNAKRKRS